MMAENNKETQWRTPDGIMRKIRMRKSQSRRASLTTLSLNSSPSLSTVANFTEITGSVGKMKRANPFATKRPHPENKEVCRKYNDMISTAEWRLVQTF